MRTARTSVNSLLRKAKSLFSTKRLRFVDSLGLPFSGPFEGVEFEPRQSMRYHILVSLEKLTAEALRELPAQELKIFLLASMAGLRRNEIDKLEWSAFRWEQSVLRIENSMHFQTKNELSRGDVDLDPELSQLFRELYAKRTGKENPSLWGFIFFTNIDLTPEEVTRLERLPRRISAECQKK